MSGGRFLVSWRDVNQSEAILKLKTLIKADCSPEDSFSVTSESQKKEALQNIDEKLLLTEVESYSLNSASREVSNMVAGYVAHATLPRLRRGWDAARGSWCPTLRRGPDSWAAQMADTIHPVARPACRPGSRTPLVSAHDSVSPVPFFPLRPSPPSKCGPSLAPVLALSPPTCPSSFSDACSSEEALRPTLDLATLAESAELA